MLALLAELRGLPPSRPPEVSLSVLMRSRFTGWYDLFRPRAGGGTAGRGGGGLRFAHRGAGNRQPLVPLRVHHHVSLKASTSYQTNGQPAAKAPIYLAV